MAKHGTGDKILKWSKKVSNGKILILLTIWDHLGPILSLTYLIIVICFTLTQFLELKFYTQMRVYIYI